MVAESYLLNLAFQTKMFFKTFFNSYFPLCKFPETLGLPWNYKLIFFYFQHIIKRIFSQTLSQKIIFMKRKRSSSVGEVSVAYNFKSFNIRKLILISIFGLVGETSQEKKKFFPPETIKTPLKISKVRKSISSLRNKTSHSTLKKLYHHLL